MSPAPAGPLSVTISVVFAALARHDDTPGSLVARAGAFMYRAKSEGRNRVVAEA